MRYGFYGLGPSPFCVVAPTVVGQAARQVVALDHGQPGAGEPLTRLVSVLIEQPADYATAVGPIRPDPLDHLAEQHIGLMVNIIVLWQTVYIQAALDHLVASGHELDPADVARLSPLGHPSINLQGGRYPTTSRAPSGGLRPLRSVV